MQPRSVLAFGLRKLVPDVVHACGEPASANDRAEANGSRARVGGPTTHSESSAIVRPNSQQATAKHHGGTRSFGRQNLAASQLRILRRSTDERLGRPCRSGLRVVFSRGLRLRLWPERSATNGTEPA